MKFAHLLIAVVALTFLGAAAVVLILVLRPDKDNGAVVAAVIGFVAPTIATLFAMTRSAARDAETQAQVAAMRPKDPPDLG